MLDLIKTISWLVGYVNILVGFYATNLSSLQSAVAEESKGGGGGNDNYIKMANLPTDCIFSLLQE